jgi:hypothetical protein
MALPQRLLSRTIHGVGTPVKCASLRLFRSTVTKVCVDGHAIPGRDKSVPSGQARNHWLWWKEGGLYRRIEFSVGTGARIGSEVLAAPAVKNEFDVESPRITSSVSEGERPLRASHRGNQTMNSARCAGRGG